MNRRLSTFFFVIICVLSGAAQPPASTERERTLFSEAVREWEATSKSILSAPARTLIQEDWIAARAEVRKSTPRTEADFDEASKAALSKYLDTQLALVDPIAMTALIAIELGNQPIGVVGIGRFGAMLAPPGGFEGTAQLADSQTSRIAVRLNARETIHVVAGGYRYAGKSAGADCSGHLVVTVGQTIDIVCPAAKP